MNLGGEGESRISPSHHVRTLISTYPCGSAVPFNQHVTSITTCEKQSGLFGELAPRRLSATQEAGRSLRCPALCLAPYWVTRVSSIIITSPDGRGATGVVKRATCAQAIRQQSRSKREPTHSRITTPCLGLPLRIIQGDQRDETTSDPETWRSASVRISPTTHIHDPQSGRTARSAPKHARV